MLRTLAACCLCLALAAEDAPKPTLGVSVDTGALEQGLPVLSVIPGSTADRMGIKVGDRITQVNGKAATNDDLRALVRTAKIGDPVKLVVRRGKEELPVMSGVLTERPTPVNTHGGLSDIRKQLAEAAAASKKPSLGEMLATLQEIQRDLPEAAAAFKAIYPNGEFDIDIRIRIVSDKTATKPIDLTPKPLSASAAAPSATAPASATKAVVP